jgi:hypothetical protein
LWGHWTILGLGKWAKLGFSPSLGLCASSSIPLLFLPFHFILRQFVCLFINTPSALCPHLSFYFGILKWMAQRLEKSYYIFLAVNEYE